MQYRDTKTYLNDFKIDDIVLRIKWSYRIKDGKHFIKFENNSPGLIRPVHQQFRFTCSASAPTYPQHSFQRCTIFKKEKHDCQSFRKTNTYSFKVMYVKSWKNWENIEHTSISNQTFRYLHMTCNRPRPLIRSPISRYFCMSWHRRRNTWTILMHLYSSTALGRWTWRHVGCPIGTNGDQTDMQVCVSSLRMTIHSFQ